MVKKRNQCGRCDEETPHSCELKDHTIKKELTVENKSDGSRNNREKAERSGVPTLQYGGLLVLELQIIMYGFTSAKAWRSRKERRIHVNSTTLYTSLLVRLTKLDVYKNQVA